MAYGLISSTSCTAGGKAITVEGTLSPTGMPLEHQNNKHRRGAGIGSMFANLRWGAGGQQSFLPPRLELAFVLDGAWRRVENRYLSALRAR
jgi:hypothetical protein